MVTQASSEAGQNPAYRPAHRRLLSGIQEWVTGRAEDLAPEAVEVVYRVEATRVEATRVEPAIGRTGGRRVSTSGRPPLLPVAE